MVLTYSDYSKIKKGNKAPEFSLKGVDGKNYSLKDFSGKSILIVFMCNHCPYVQPKFHYLSELQEKYSEIKVIGINPNSGVVEEDSFEKMKDYSEKNSFKFIYLDDASQETAKKYNAVCTPDPFLFDSRHKLVFHGRFDDAHMKKHKEGKTSEMEDAIKQLTEGKEITVKEEPSCGCSIKWK